MSVNQRIVKQFKQPHGLIGQLAGYIMANRPSNIERNEWTLELLSLEPEDRLLEIGFGPGIAIAKASEIITNGLIFGIDHSETMLRQAHKRNLAAIQRKRVQLQLGTVDSIPRFDRPFNKVFSANVVQFWADPVEDFKKLRSHMAQGAVIATTYLPRHGNATSASALEKAEEISKYLDLAGFTSIRIEQKPLLPVAAISVVAVNE